MSIPRLPVRLLILAVALGLCGAAGGCRSGPQRLVQACCERLPNEKDKTNMPEYTIEPPDVLNIEAIRLVPKPGYKLESFDSLFVQFPGDPAALSEEELKDLETTGFFIRGTFRINPDGNVKLPARFGSVKVVGKTIDEAEKLIEKIIRAKVQPIYLKKGGLIVELAEFRGLQAIQGDHLVRPDGTVHLGIYGTVYVCGLTEKQAKEVIEQHLTQYLQKPEILLEVSGFNSRVFYIITDGAGQGEQIVRQPVTGNDTVLDAIANTGGLPALASKARIWVSRPAPGGKDQVLPVYWRDITRRGRTETNYQLLPGDRLYLAATPLNIITNYLNQIAAPVERVFSTILLGQATVQSIRFGTGFFGGGFFGNPFFPVVPPVQ